jgi:lysophospholipase L1-like esterase
MPNYFLKVFTVAWVFLMPCLVSATVEAAPVRIMATGDSITWDTYTNNARLYSLSTGYRQPLWHLLKDAGYYVDFVGSRIAGQAATPAFDPDNEGYPGWRDDEIAAIIYDRLVANTPDIVLLHIGTNGLNVSPADVENILDEVDRYESYSGSNVTVYLARIINRSTYSAETTQFNNNVAAMAQLRINDGDSIVLVDMESLADIDYRLEPLGDMRDQLHPNQNGYDEMAKIWMYALEQHLTLPPAAMPPVITTTPESTTVFLDTTFSYTAVTTGAQPISYTLDTGPSGMTIDPVTGTVSWTPSIQEQAQVSIVAQNGIVPNAVQNFMVDTVAPPTAIILESGVPQTSSVNRNEWVYFRIDTTDQDTDLILELSNLSSDVDLYVLPEARPDLANYSCRPYRGGTNPEECTISSPGNQTWFVGIHGYTAGTFKISATRITPVILSSGSQQTDTVALHQWRYYSITASSSDTTLDVTINNLSRDVDLYVLKGAQPTLTAYDCRPYAGGTNVETCSMANSEQVTWHIGVYGFTAASYTISTQLTAAGINQAPVMTAINSQVIAEGMNFVLPVSATDPDGPSPLMLVANDLPLGAQFTDYGDGTGLFSWTPAIGDAAGSPYAVNFSATDDGGLGLTDDIAVTIQVNPTTGDGHISLEPGIPQSASVELGEWMFYSIATAANDMRLEIKLTGLSSDNDLYVRNGTDPTLSTYDCRPYAGQTTEETCIFQIPGATTWLIGVHGFTAGTFTINANVISPIPLSSGDITSGTLVLGEWHYYVIETTGSDSELVAGISSLSADVDLYVRKSAYPSINTYDCRPYLGQTNPETCTLPNTGSATWFVGVNGFKAGNYSLTVATH